MTVTLTFKLDLDGVKLDQRAKYLGERSYSSRVIFWTQRQAHAHETSCSTWTTK